MHTQTCGLPEVTPAKRHRTAILRCAEFLPLITKLYPDVSKKQREKLNKVAKVEFSLAILDR